MILVSLDAGGNVPTATDFPSSRNSLATLRHLSRWDFISSGSIKSGDVLGTKSIFLLQDFHRK